MSWPELYVREIQVVAERIGRGYPFELPALRGLSSLPLRSPVTLFSGANGSGKSTLLEAIAVAAGLNAEGGSENLRFSTRPSHSPLHHALRLVRGERRPRTRFFLRAESFFNLATAIEALDAEPGPGAKIGPSYGPRALHEQSHGESFWSLFTHRLGDQGLYVFDEPEAALSPGRQLELLRWMSERVRGGCQFLIATHSPILLAMPRAQLFELSDGVRELAYDDCQVVRTYREFLAHPPWFTGGLLD